MTCERLVAEVTEGRARPRRQGGLQHGDGGVRRAGCDGLTSQAEAAFEPRCIELVVGGRQPIASRMGGDSIGLGAEDVAQPRNVDLDRLDRGERLLVRPQSIGNGRRRDRSIPLQQEEREDAPLAGATELERPSVDEHSDIAEKPKLHRHAGPPPLAFHADSRA